ncbi:MAG: chorismate synthase, partial [Thermomicrobium sp.]
DPVAAQKMVAAILEAKEQKTSVGGIVEVRAVNVPPGLGEPTMDKLDALIGYAMLSIPAVKGVEIGDGFAAARLYGHEHNDPFVLEDGRVRTLTNHAGGMLGGISTGEEIVVRLAVKPTSSIGRPQQTVDIYGNERTIVVEGRHDPSICPRVVPVAEAMLLLV